MNWPQKPTQSGNTHSIILDMHVVLRHPVTTLVTAFNHPDKLTNYHKLMKIITCGHYSLSMYLSLSLSPSQGR